MPKKTFEAVAAVKGELVVQIKENQKELYRETQEACEYLKPLSTFISPIEKGRNRIEERTAEVFEIGDCLIESSAWKRYIACVIQVKRHTALFETKDKTWKIREETAYYAASHLHDAQIFADHIRQHWHIENRNHYVRDVSLGEDASRIRVQPGVFARLRSFALNVLRFNHVKNVKGALFENALNFEHLVSYSGVL